MTMLKLADRQRTAYVISLAAAAPPPEKTAARELAAHLRQICGARFRIVTPAQARGRPCLAVGPGAARRAGLPAAALRGLGNEGILIRTLGRKLVLTGGPRAARGTLYAVHTFLEESLGCRWWTPGATFIPRSAKLELPPFNKRIVPVLEYRETFLRDALEARWSVRNKVNALNAVPNITKEWGGRVIYQPGHTFHALVPPAQHFAAHPEWYAEIGGQRSAKGQLCLTNRELAAFVTERIRQQLRKMPAGAIVSVAQDDNSAYCRCAACRALDRKEGSPAGALLRFVNRVAAGIEKEFPRSAINTFAYLYTRRPPRRAKARRNVVVQLCSYECDFLHPLGHPNNAPFRADLRKWARACKRLFIWDYAANFAHYLQPHPSWYVMGDNIRFFIRHHVKGIFNEGNYQSPGGELAPLRAWVLAKLMWDPARNNAELVGEFLAGYYGPAGRHLEAYLRGIHAAALAADDFPGSLAIRRLFAHHPRYARARRRGLYLDLGIAADAPHLAPAVMLQAWPHLLAAQNAVRGDAVLRARVELAGMPLLYAALIRWPDLVKQARKTGQDWPLPATREKAYRTFAALYHQHGITHLGEGKPHTRGLAWLRKVLRGKAAWSW